MAEEYCTQGEELHGPHVDLYLNILSTSEIEIRTLVEKHLRQKYKAAAKKLHPDKNHGATEATGDFQNVEASYRALQDAAHDYPLTLAEEIIAEGRSAISVRAQSRKDNMELFQQLEHVQTQLEEARRELEEKDEQLTRLVIERSRGRQRTRLNRAPPIRMDSADRVDNVTGASTDEELHCYDSRPSVPRQHQIGEVVGADASEQRSPQWPADPQYAQHCQPDQQPPSPELQKAAAQVHPPPLPGPLDIERSRSQADNCEQNSPHDREVFHNQQQFDERQTGLGGRQTSVDLKISILVPCAAAGRGNSYVEGLSSQQSKLCHCAAGPQDHSHHVPPEMYVKVANVTLTAAVEGSQLPVVYNTIPVHRAAAEETITSPPSVIIAPDAPPESGNPGMPQKRKQKSQQKRKNQKNRRKKTKLEAQQDLQQQHLPSVFAHPSPAGTAARSRPDSVSELPPNQLLPPVSSIEVDSVPAPAKSSCSQPPTAVISSSTRKSLRKSSSPLPVQPASSRPTKIPVVQRGSRAM